MKIYINGKQLDTYAKSVSVKKTNNLWKFGKAEFERTQTITIPATNNNKSILDFADEFRTQSSVARGYVECMVYEECVVKPARLYVSGYKSDEFSCILIFGKALQSLDLKLSEYIGDIEDFNTVLGLTENFKELNLYDKEGNAVKRFIVLFNYLFGLLNGKGIDIIDYDAFTTNALAYAVDYNSTNIEDVGGKKDGTLSRVYGTKSTSSTNTTPIFAYSFDYAFFNNYKSKTSYTLLMSTEYDGATLYKSYYAPLEYYQFPFDIVLNFGSGCSDYAIGFLGTGTTYRDAFSSLRGHYRGDGWLEVSEDLSAQSITIKANTKFILLQYGDFYDGTVSHPTIPGVFLSVQGLYYADYGGTANRFTNITITLPIFNYNFVPDITLFQLLQTMAAYKGKMLYFDGTKFTVAGVGDIRHTPKCFAKDAIDYEVSDKAFDFAQNNKVKFKSGGNELDYKINNIHLPESKEILTIPFDGGNYVAGGSTVFRLADGFPAIGSINGLAFMFNNIGEITDLESLLNSTRQVKIKFRMPYVDFDDVAELDCFQYKGALLQWVDLTWSDGWCTATLQTI